MRIHRRSILPLCVALLGIAAAPDVAAAKCAPSVGHPVLPGYLFILDGRVVGEYAMDQEPEHFPAAEDIHSIEVACVDNPQPDARGARQVAKIVVTRSGFADAARLALTQLVEAQTAYHEKHRRYASDLTALNVVGLGKYVPIHMAANETGFAAQISSDSRGVLCAVGLGSAREIAAPLRLSRAQLRGTPECRRI
jgi:hypothetical protein